MKPLLVLSALPAAEQRSAGPQRPLPRASRAQPVRHRAARPGPLCRCQHRGMRGTDTPLASRRCQLHTSYASGQASPGMQSWRFTRTAPKIAVSSTHLEPRPVAFWQAEEEIVTCLLLSVSCWALQIKASSVQGVLLGPELDIRQRSVE